MTRTPILFSANRLYKRYGDTRVLQGLTFHIHEGEVVALLGPNGAGKTTAFYIAMGLISPDEGEILFQNIPITHLPIEKRARLGIGYLAQEPSIFRCLNVEDNLTLVLEYTPLSRQEQGLFLEHALQELHLTHLRHHLASSLSGGERRRLEIARALLQHPKLLLLDEPFANIDPITIEEVKRLILHLKQKGISILITDHNARELLEIVDRSYLLQAGRVSLSGTVQELLDHPEARMNYFGKHFTMHRSESSSLDKVE
jgi:lipopolysaccharide export system ATP-binding protein